jgi:acyl-CoA thioester hydrolase
MKALVTATVQAAPQFYDLDPLNMVWHGNYPRFLELARVALMDKIGYGYKDMQASGFEWPIVGLRMRYVRSLRLAQRFSIEAGIIEWENQLKIAYELRDASDGSRIMRASSVQVAVEAATGEMQWASPPILRERLSPYLS